MNDLERQLNKVDKWIRPNLKEIIRMLPFNPIIARKAFDELLFPEKAGNFRKISELFATDPGLMRIYMKFPAPNVLIWNGNILMSPTRNWEPGCLHTLDWVRTMFFQY